MFDILVNKTIKISRGDDSARFPLFLNKGTHLAPIRYELSPDITIKVTSYSKTFSNVKVDQEKFMSVLPDVGIYSFYFRKYYWYFNGELINLSDFGISYEGQPQNEDSITVIFTRDETEIYFYIMDHNVKNTEDYIVKKTFKKNGEIISQYKNKPPFKYVDENIINENGDFMLRIDGRDTENLPGSEYLYMIKAKVFDSDLQKYVLNTVTNKLPLYVIDDEFDRSW